MLHCLDYILGSDKLRKRVAEIEPYATLFVEFGNSEGKSLSLRRALSGGNLAAYDQPIDQISGAGQVISPRRYGKSVGPDVTSLLFPFAGIPEAQLRSNDQGKVQRLTIRTLLPIFLVDEISVIAEQSPVLGEISFGDTARKRMLSFLLTGKDDADVVADEKREIVSARLAAKLGVIDDLIAPIQKRLDGLRQEDSIDSVERLDTAIELTRATLQNVEIERERLQEARLTAAEELDHANSQVVAIDERKRGG